MVWEEQRKGVEMGVREKKRFPGKKKKTPPEENRIGKVNYPPKKNQMCVNEDNTKSKHKGGAPNGRRQCTWKKPLTVEEPLKGGNSFLGVQDTKKVKRKLTKKKRKKKKKTRGPKKAEAGGSKNWVTEVSKGERKRKKKKVTPRC